MNKLTKFWFREGSMSSSTFKGSIGVKGFHRNVVSRLSTARFDYFYEYILVLKTNDSWDFGVFWHTSCLFTIAEQTNLILYWTKNILKWDKSNLIPEEDFLVRLNVFAFKQMPIMIYLAFWSFKSQNDRPTGESRHLGSGKSVSTPKSQRRDTKPTETTENSTLPCYEKARVEMQYNVGERSIFF